MTQQKDEHAIDSDDLALIKSYLAERDVRCPGCGYNLRGLTQPSCPECGDRISLTVTNYPSRSGGYIAGLIGLTLSVLLALVFAAANWRAVPVLSILSLFIAAWIARSALRWRNIRVEFSGLHRHKKQERLFTCWLGAVIYFIAILAMRAVT